MGRLCFLCASSIEFRIPQTPSVRFDRVASTVTLSRSFEYVLFRNISNRATYILERKIVFCRFIVFSQCYHFLLEGLCLSLGLRESFFLIFFSLLSRRSSQARANAHAHSVSFLCIAGTSPHATVIPFHISECLFFLFSAAVLQQPLVVCIVLLECRNITCVMYFLCDAFFLPLLRILNYLLLSI